jgi:hypothetical protein
MHRNPAIPLASHAAVGSINEYNSFVIRGRRCGAGYEKAFGFENRRPIMPKSIRRKDEIHP